MRYLMLLASLSLSLGTPLATHATSPAPTKARATTKASPAQASGAPQVALAQISLTNPGQAPRKLMRYQFVPFQGVKMYVLTKMSMQLVMQTGKAVRKSPPIPTPGLRVETTMHSQGTRDDGYSHIHGTITGIKVLPSVKTSPMVIIQLRKALNRLKGMKMTYVFDAQGRLRQGGFRMPKNSSQQLRQILDNLKQNMQQIIIPLPAKPIGIGATWTARVAVTKPVKMTQSTTLTLQKWSKGKATVQSDMRQLATKQNISSQSPYGPVNNLIHFLRTTAKGQSEIGFRSLYIRTQSTGKSDMKITVTVRKRSRTINFHMDMSNNMRAGK